MENNIDMKKMPMDRSKEIKAMYEKCEKEMEKMKKMSGDMKKKE